MLNELQGAVGSHRCKRQTYVSTDTSFSGIARSELVLCTSRFPFIVRLRQHKFVCRNGQEEILGIVKVEKV